MTDSLKLIKSKLKQAITLYPFSISQSNNLFTINNLDKLKKFVSLLRDSKVFTQQVDLLSESIIFTTQATSITVQYTEGRQIEQTLDLLKILIENFNVLLDSTVPEDQPNSINIKLPDNVNNFSSLSRISNDLNIAIGQILSSSDFNCETRIMSVENGSIWANILLIVEEAKIPGCIALVGQLIRAGIKLRIQWFEGSKLKEEVRKLKLENDKIAGIETLEETIDNRNNAVLENEAKEIEDKYFEMHGHDPETYERIKNAIKILSEWQEKGLIITPSLNQGNLNLENFPTVSETLLLDRKTKELDRPKQ